MSMAGAHVPVIPLLDVVGKGANASPEQIGDTASNVGVIFGVTFTVTSSKDVSPHISRISTVYVVVTEGINTGLGILGLLTPSVGAHI
ncbi:MAG: hypothetical protein ED556_04115 [Winogradskyella sp.]|nr:MAG: hypothetical protein ED556_04115 [Winogradskyella sp.]